jgi:hypothetical protein
VNSSNQALAALVAHAGSSVDNHRRLDRAKAVLPVKISGNDTSGEAYSELVHTLDVSRNGVRLGAVRRRLEVGSVLSFNTGNTRRSFAWFGPSRWVPVSNNRLACKPTYKKICGESTTPMRPTDRRWQQLRLRGAPPLELEPSR